MNYFQRKLLVSAEILKTMINLGENYDSGIVVCVCSAFPQNIYYM